VLTHQYDLGVVVRILGHNLLNATIHPLAEDVRCCRKAEWHNVFTTQRNFRLPLGVFDGFHVSCMIHVGVIHGLGVQAAGKGQDCDANGQRFEHGFSPDIRSDM
jgi:hypothetical protein